MSVIAPTPTSVVEAGLDLRNLGIDEVIVHRVFARDANKVVKDPVLADKLMVLPAAGLDAIQQRLTVALGSRSHGVEMSIEKADADSFIQLGADAICRDQAAFVASSRSMAVKLSKAQAATSGSPGMLIVIRGRAGGQPRRFLAVVKAEVHDGFGAGGTDQAVAVEYISSLMLTPQQRLFKVGLLLELASAPPRNLGDYKPAGYRAFLFDHLITATETRSAAAYFYGGFLGMDIQKSSKKLTQDFYEYTQTFIKTASLSEEDKSELKEALRVSLRSADAIISVTDFAKSHIPDEEVRSSYVSYLEGKGFPKNAVVKDVEYVKSRLRKPRRLAFTSGVRITVPADAAPDDFVMTERTETHATVMVRGSFTESE
ncbi:nucleoid-associated protein [Dyella kyungheensis]|uniref:nucleoid-associated protein n=1 Tax=Dyella kyungheensis TaxID=1242174 RepID=UPI003CF6F207